VAWKNEVFSMLLRWDKGLSITRRHAAFGIQIVMLLGLLPPIVLYIATGSPPATVLLTIALLIAECITAVALWRDQPVAYPALVALSIANSVIVPPITTLSLETLLILLIPLVVALIVGRPSWVIASAIVTPLLFLVRAGEQLLNMSPVLVGIYLMFVTGIVLARMVVDSALNEALAHARQAEEAQGHLDTQARQLAQANRQQEEQLHEQRRLLDLVTALETPVVQIATGVLLVPIVGHVDSQRAAKLTTRLLHVTQERRARLVILDVAAVPVIDTAVTRVLLTTAQAVRLLGCQVAISGISATIAMTLTNLDISLTGITTVRSPQDALEQQKPIQVHYIAQREQ
jgi:rsbT co-antagonist protein RsbR